MFTECVLAGLESTSVPLRGLRHLQHLVLIGIIRLESIHEPMCQALCQALCTLGACALRQTFGGGGVCLSYLSGFWGEALSGCVGQIVS